MKYHTKKKALILLADGTIFYGKAVGGREGNRSRGGMFQYRNDRLPRDFY